jgi:hypothetical protein
MTVFFRISGFIGDFKCTSSNGTCQIYSVGRSSEGDFTYDYSPNTNILLASGMRVANTTIPSTPKKRRNLLRDLQITNNTPTSGVKITNPVMCIK